MPELAPILLTTHGDPINVAVRYSGRAVRYSIRVTNDGAELVLPLKGNFKKAQEFLLSREFWIRAKLRTRTLEAPSTHIPIYGQPHAIVVGKQCSPMIDDGKVFAPSKNALGTFLKEVIKLDLKECALALSKQLGVTYNRISIKDTKGQWGSCSHAGNLSFSWRLIFAPKFVMEYLVAHELSHIIEKNHGPRFWALVKSLHPEHAAARKWLKHNGALLHRYLA